VISEGLMHFGMPNLAEFSIILFALSIPSTLKADLSHLTGSN